MAAQRLRIAVVGGGPAGLTAAYRLIQRGVEVVVLEARDRPGGRTRTDTLDGSRVDAGAQLFGSMYTRFSRLVDEVGLGRKLVRSPGRDALWRGGRAHEVTYGSVTSMVASGGLAWRTKMRLGTTYVPFLTRNVSSLDLHAPERAAFAGLDRETIAEWGRREVGSEFVEYLVYPQLAAYHGALPEETTSGLYHILARYGMDVSLFALEGGAALLSERLSQRVAEQGGAVRCGSPVDTVDLDGEGATVRSRDRDERFDAAVIAAPAPVSARVLRGGPEALTNWLEHVRFRPAVTLALLLDRPLGVRYFGLSVPREASGSVAAVCVQENKGAALVPPGRGLLVAFARPESAGEMMRMDAPDVLAAMLPDLERLFPGLRASVSRARAYRWEHGQATFYPGYLGRIAAFRGGGIEGGARAALAGDYLCFPSIEGAVASGEDAAERLLARLRSAV